MSLAPPCFAFVLANEDAARKFMRQLKIIVRCTSLGGIETSIDLRTAHDPNVAPGCLRISVGLEDPNDIIADLKQAFEAISQNEKPSKEKRKKKSKK